MINIHYKGFLESSQLHNTNMYRHVVRGMQEEDPVASSPSITLLSLAHGCQMPSHGWEVMAHWCPPLGGHGFQSDN